MDRLTANFYPASEPKPYEGGVYVGKANITIANAMRLNDISVFLSDAGKLSINFPEYESGGEKKSFVIPKSKEAYAAMCSVVEKARESEQGFAFTQGTYNPTMTARGGLVNEPFADGRFGVEVGDICTIVGLTTRKASYTVDNEEKHFVAVDLPNIIGQDGKPSTYEKDGKTMYNKVFEPCVSSWTDTEGHKRSKDFGRTLTGAVLKCRKELLEKEASKEQAAPEKKAEPKQRQASKTTKAKKTGKAKEPEMSM